MTSTSKSAQFRDVAVSTGGDLFKAAKIVSTGYAGLGLQAARSGYGFARRELERRKAHRAVSTTQKSLTTVSAPRISSRNKKLIAVGAVVGLAAGAAVFAAKRRHTQEPPADAPPSLEDYSDTPTSVNGSTAAVAQK